MINPRIRLQSSHNLIWPQQEIVPFACHPIQIHLGKHLVFRMS